MTADENPQQGDRIARTGCPVNRDRVKVRMWIASTLVIASCAALNAAPLAIFEDGHAIGAGSGVRGVARTVGRSA